MRRSPSIPASCVGMKLMKIVMRMNMRSCMRIQDDHHEEINGSGGYSDDDPHQIKKSKSKSKSGRSSKSSSSSSIIKVVNWEGGIMKTYWRPIKVGEVIMESPKQQSYMVCSSDSLYIGQKIPPLSDQHLLQPGHTYFLLPSHLFNSTLSFAIVASILSTSSSAPHASSQNNNNNSIFIKKKKKKKKKKSLEPFLIQKSPSGCSTIRVSDDFIISHIVSEDEDDDDDDDDKYRSCLCTTPQLQKEYAQLVQSRRPQWKPKLPTITESKSNYSKRRRRRLKNKLNNNNNNNNNISSNSSTSSISNNTKGKGHRKMKFFKSTKSSTSSHYSCPKV